MIPGSTENSLQQEYQTIIDSASIYSQESGTSVHLASARPDFIEQQITIGENQSVHIQATFVVQQGSGGDRVAIAAIPNANARGMYTDALVVSFGNEGQGHISIYDERGTQWNHSFSHDPIPPGSEVTMDIRYDGHEVRAVFLMEGKTIASQTATPNRQYSSFYIGTSDSAWDKERSTDARTALSITKLTERQVPVSVTLPGQSPEELDAIYTVFSDPNFMEDLNRRLAGEPVAAQETSESAPQTSPSLARFSAFAENSAQTERIANHTARLESIEAALLEERKEIETAQTLLTESNAVIAAYDKQRAAEQTKVTPTITVETKRLDRHIYVSYTDMPQGYYLTLDGRRVDASDARYDIPGGSGSAVFDMPRFGAADKATVELRNAQGKVVTDLHVFNHTKDAASKTGAGTSDKRLRQLAYTPGLPEHLKITSQQYQAAIIDGVSAGRVISECNDRIAELEGQKTALEREMTLLQEGPVPDAMAYFTTENIRNTDGFIQDAWLRVNYHSPHDQTYFEITVQNDGGAGFRGTVEHEGGARNKTISFNSKDITGGNGSGNVHVAMYTDATKTELLDSFDVSYDRNSRTFSGESTMDRGAFEEGMRIEQGAEGMSAVLPLEGLSGSVTLQSWNTPGATGSVHYDAADRQFQTTGSLASLDFSALQGTVTDIYADLDIPEGVTVEAMLFRGGVQVGSVTLTAGTPLLWSDPQGISAILFKTSEPAELTLRELIVQEGAEQLFSADALSRAENIVLAQELGTQDWGQIRDILVYPRFENVLGSHNIYNHRGGAAGAINNQYVLLGYGGGTYTEYTLYKPDTTGSGAALGEVRYLNDQGFHVLPREYYTVVNGAVILHPGAPKNIAVQVAGGTGVTVYQAGTSQDIDLLINSQTAFHPEVSVQHLVNGPTSQTGFSDGFNEIGQVKRPVIAAGETFHVVSLVYNNSGVSGQITVEVFTGDDNNLVAGDTYTGTIGAYQRAQFVANATSPANATGLPSVRFRVTLPDGTQYWSGGMRSAEPEAAPGEGGARQRLGQALPGLAATANEFGVTSSQYKAELARLTETYGSAFSGRLNDAIVTSRNVLGLSDPNGSEVVTGGHTEANAVLSSEVVFISGHTPLGTFGHNQELTGNRTVYLSEHGLAKFTFTLTEEKMVNLWVPGTDQRDITLGISGSTLEGGGYESKKSGFGAESVSLRLTPGTYTISVIDNTDYSQTISSGNFSVQLGSSSEKYDSANIRGMITIEGSDKVMPVSMRVAEFDSNGRRLEVPEKGLDPNKPIWVVVHGMDSKSDDVLMNELTKSLYSYAPEGIQVVSVDWREAAASGFIMTQDAPWTTPVGKWSAQQLINSGFRPDQVNVVGWSHGTFVAYEMGRELQRIGSGQMHTLVALDAARNIPLISGYSQQPDFTSVSTQSIAFDSSVIAGDNVLATKADYSFMVRSTELDPSVRHKLAVTTFTSLLNDHGHSAQFSQVLNFQKLRERLESTNILTQDAYMGGFEGVIDIGVERTTIQNETYYKALPQTMSIIRPGTSSETYLYFHSLET